LVIALLDKTYGFANGDWQRLRQMQWRSYKTIDVKSATPWLLYIAGAFISIILAMLDVSALAFALGMYLPLELNTPLLIGD